MLSCASKPSFPPSRPVRANVRQPIEFAYSIAFSTLGEFCVGDLEAALRLIDDVVKIVLERDAGHARMKRRMRGGGKSNGNGQKLQAPTSKLQ